ncbi:MAG: DUF11 domain-containing protein, partial [Clostridia bacterium]|nr:DUF11 domain-containing protein [Clostridia bacterium]
MKKAIIRVISMLIVICVISSTLIACLKEAHVHSYGATVVSDGEYHWKECTCGEKTEVEAHRGGTATCTEKAICEVCDETYGETEAHSYVLIDPTTETTHSYLCQCGECEKTEEHSGGTPTCAMKAECSACGALYGDTLPHSYTVLKSKNATSHNYKCACGAEEGQKPHTYEIVEYYNNTVHWLACVCGQKDTAKNHTLVNGICSACGYRTPEADHVHNFSVLNHSAEEHWYECECKETDNREAHKGGKATCTELAACEICKVSYGYLADHSYTVTLITENDHSYECECGKSGEKSEHNFINGVCACGYEATDASHEHDFSILKFSDSKHWYECSCKVAFAITEHKGGAATCTDRATCEICNQAYGQVNHKWNDGELTYAPHGDEKGVVTYTCKECKEIKREAIAADTTVITRADIEEALVAVAWAYYAKGTKLQYDSIALSMINNHYGGTGRHTNEASPEYGTSDTTIFSVCTGFSHKVYIETINRWILEHKYTPNGIVTAYMWLAADNQPEEGFKKDQTDTDPITEDNRDTAIIRWIDYAKYLEKEDDEVCAATNLGVFEATSLYDWYTDGKLEFKKTDDGNDYSYYLNGEKISASKAKELVLSYITKKVDGEYVNLRPGDLITEDTHTLVYIGGGYVLDCNGYKYDIATGLDAVEKNGGLGIRMKKIEDTLSAAEADYVIMRALDFYTYDCDGDAGNDIIMYGGESIEITKASLSRITYPMMDIDRTVDITPFGTAAKDDTITYTVKISNKTNEEKFRTWKKLFVKSYSGEAYEDLLVTERIPEGTELVSATEGYTLEDGVLTWIIDVSAGASVEISYTVKVTAAVGSVIVNDGGTVANIPSNSISNRVGNEKLTEDQKDILTSLADEDLEKFESLYGTDLDFAEGIYAEMGVDLSLPTVAEIIENLFTPVYMDKITAFSTYYPDIESPIVMYAPAKEVSAEYELISKMIVDRYVGGYRYFPTDLGKF